MPSYRNVSIDGCRSCERQDHQHWIEEFDERVLEDYRNYVRDRGRPSDDDKRQRAA